MPEDIRPRRGTPLQCLQVNEALRSLTVTTENKQPPTLLRFHTGPLFQILAASFSITKSLVFLTMKVQPWGENLQFRRSLAAKFTVEYEYRALVV